MRLTHSGEDGFVLYVPSEVGILFACKFNSAFLDCYKQNVNKYSPLDIFLLMNLNYINFFNYLKEGCIFFFHISLKLFCPSFKKGGHIALMLLVCR